MKALVGDPFDRWRDVSDAMRRYYGGIGDETCGVFVIPHSAIYGVRRLTVIASCDGGWDHVSVSVAGRKDAIPNWVEMKFVKDRFFKAGEWAIEYHPATSENISVHHGCLHLWRPQEIEIPRPPAWMVG